MPLGEKMIDKIRRFIVENEMIKTGDHCMAGVSGGADSVCLLIILDRLKEQLGFTLEVIHVEHGIRGDESLGDADFVRDLCDRLGVKCTVYNVDAVGYADNNGLGLEEAARILRYECYAKAADASLGDKAFAEGVGRVRIALAHHADDNAETILFQMARGSGIKGLSGMEAVRGFGENAAIIRPLLSVTRAQIETALAGWGETYRIDSTNTDTNYSRNRIRHNIIPELVRINDAAILHIGRSAGYMKEIIDYVDIESEKVWNGVCRDDGNGIFISEELLANHIAIRRNIIHRALALVSKSSKDIGDAHIESALELMSLQVGRKIALPYRVEAARVYGGIHIHKAFEERKDTDKVNISISDDMIKALENGETVSVELSGAELSMHLVAGDFAGVCPPKKKYTKWFDYDIIKCGLKVRKRESGDYFLLDNEGHRKKLKEYFITEKIPSDQREGIWLLAQGSRIAWIIGGRISADVKVGGATKRVIEITYQGNFDNTKEESDNED
jgi:tRNA(Ile)-lysidine synthase